MTTMLSTSTGTMTTMFLMVRLALVALLPATFITAAAGAGQYFPSDYCRVDRIVAHRSALDAGGSKRTLRLADLREGKHWDECEFLVRWMQQGYDEATWEPYSTLRLLDCQEDVRNEIMRYFRFVEPLPIATPKPAPTKKETKKRSTSSSRNNNAATAAWKV